MSTFSELLQTISSGRYGKDIRTAIHDALEMIVNNIASALGWDDTPTEGSSNGVKSGGVFSALALKQDVLTVDNIPAKDSTNLVKSGGVFTAFETASSGRYAELFSYGHVNIDTTNKTMTVSATYTLKVGNIRRNNITIDFSGLDYTANQTIYYDGDSDTIKVIGYGQYTNLENVAKTAILGSVWSNNVNYRYGYYSLNTPMDILVDGVKQLKLNDVFRGRSIDAFGDSICAQRTDDGSGSATYATKTLKLLTETNLGIPYTSHAVGGKHWANFGAAKDMYGQLRETDALSGDVFLLWAGTNDYAGGAPLGAITDTPAWTNVNNGGTFYGCVKYCIEYILTQKPAAEILIITPTYRNYCGSTIGNCYTTVTNGVGKTLGDYCDALVAIGRAYNIPVLDMRDNSPINFYNVASMLTEQGEGTGKYLHPLDATYTILNRKVMNWMRSVI